MATAPQPETNTTDGSGERRLIDDRRERQLRRPALAPDLRIRAVRPKIDRVTLVLAIGVMGLTWIGGSGSTPQSDAAPPPAGRFAHGAAGTARNGIGGSVGASRTVESWPGTGNDRNGGPFAFIGAQYGSLWGIPPTANNSLGVGYCVMEDVGGEGAVSVQPDPTVWDASEMARAAALMSTFGGDRVVPYGIDASGAYDVAAGEWLQPALFGGGEYTRRRHIAVNFGVKMFLEDVSPSGIAAGRKLARDTAIVDGSGGDYTALRDGYTMAQRMASSAEIQSAVGGVRLEMRWSTATGAPPTEAGTYPLDVLAIDTMGKPVGFVPVVQLSDVGIDANRSKDARASVLQSTDNVDDAARRHAAVVTGWPTWDMVGEMAADARFAVGANPAAAAVTDSAGVARFDVAIAGPDWELAFHTQAPTADVDLHTGTGIQGQVTWNGAPQSASVHQVMESPVVGRFVVRKALDATDVQADRDMSGFVFDVREASSDGGVGDTIATVTSRADGRTPPIETVAGDYTIVEVGRPAWANGLGDRGPVPFRFDPARGATDETMHAEVTYTNTVPSPTISTSAVDERDGDKYLDAGAATFAAGSGADNPDAAGPTIVDTVTYEGLVPGTRYLARSELHALNAACTRWCRTRFGTALEFVPGTADGAVDVELDLRAASEELRGAVAVVGQRIEVAGSGRVVAEHVDTNDLAQTVYFPTMSSRFQAVTAPADESNALEVGDEAVDIVDWAGLAVGERYRIEMTLHQRLDDGMCVPVVGAATGIGATVEFEAAGRSGVVNVGPLAVAHAGVFVAYERLYVRAGMATELGVDSEVATWRLISAHEDCGDETQTIRVAAPPTPDTTAADTTTPETTAPSSPPTTAGTTTAPTTTTTTTPPSAPPPTPKPPTLPRSGGTIASTTIGMASALLMIGVGFMIIAGPGVRNAPRRTVAEHRQ